MLIVWGTFCYTDGPGRNKKGARPTAKKSGDTNVYGTLKVTSSDFELHGPNGGYFALFHRIRQPWGQLR